MDTFNFREDNTKIIKRGIQNDDQEQGVIMNKKCQYVKLVNTVIGSDSHVRRTRHVVTSQKVQAHSSQYVITTKVIKRRSSLQYNKKNYS